MKKLYLLGGLCIGLLIISCNPNKKEYITNNGFAQGTTYHIVYNHPVNLQDSIENLLDKFNKSLSLYDSLSVISKINKNIDPQTDHWFTEVFNKSKEIYIISDGYFDITVGPLVNAYGFGSERKQTINQHIIDSLLQFVGIEKVNLTEGKIIKADPRIKIDMNALAQGYSVDVVSQFLESHNISDYLVEIGGEIRAKGNNPKGEKWKVGVDKPIEGNNTPGESIQEIVELQNKSLATSGNYRKFYEENGVKYTHTINPKTGLSVQSNLLSATIIADDCMTADALATTCMVIGLDKAKMLLEKLPDIQALFIYADDKGNYLEYKTPGFQ